MSREDLLTLPVRDLVHPEGAALLLWVTSDQLGWAVSDLIPAWGFSYKSRAFDWIKIRNCMSIESIIVDAIENHCDVDWGQVLEGCLAVGMGYYTRQQGEECLLATTDPPPRRKSASVRQVVMSPRREHSRKPDSIYERIEALFDGPYLELFARTQWSQKWDVWGDETNKFRYE